MHDHLNVKIYVIRNAIVEYK